MGSLNEELSPLDWMVDGRQAYNSLSRGSASLWVERQMSRQRSLHVLSASDCVAWPAILNPRFHGFLITVTWNSKLNKVLPPRGFFLSGHFIKKQKLTAYHILIPSLDSTNHSENDSEKISLWVMSLTQDSVWTIGYNLRWLYLLSPTTPGLWFVSLLYILSVNGCMQGEDGG